MEIQWVMQDLKSNCGKCWNYGPPSSTQAQVHKLSHHWKCKQVKLIHPPRKLCTFCLFLAMSSFCPVHLPSCLSLFLIKYGWWSPGTSFTFNCPNVAGSKYHASHSKFISWPAKLPNFLMWPPFIFIFLHFPLDHYSIIHSNFFFLLPISLLLEHTCCVIIIIF